MHIKQTADGWNVFNAANEPVAGPFDTEAEALEWIGQYKNDRPQGG